MSNAFKYLNQGSLFAVLKINMKYMFKVSILKRIGYVCLVQLNK